MMVFTDEAGFPVHLETTGMLRWYGKKGGRDARPPAYVLLTVEGEIRTLRGAEAERFMAWVDLMNAALPTHCYHCGVYLRGGMTEHLPGCEVLALIREVYREGRRA